jgi:hypothetical protein
MNPTSSPTVQSSLSPSASTRSLSSDLAFFVNGFPSSNNTVVETFENFTYAFLKSKETAKSNIDTTMFKIKSIDEVTITRRLRGLSDASGSKFMKIEATVSAITNIQTPAASKDLFNFAIQAILSNTFMESLANIDLFAGVVLSRELPSPITPPDDGKTPNKPGIEESIQEGVSEEPRKTSMTTIVLSAVIASAFMVLSVFFLKKKAPQFIERLKHIREVEDHSDDSSSSYSSAPDEKDDITRSQCLPMHPSDDSPINLNIMDDIEQNNMPQTEEEHIELPDTSLGNVKKSLFESSPSSTSTPMDHIPPMIVIDNIDEEMHSPNNISTPKTTQEQRDDEDDQTGLRVQRIEATSDLVAALSAHKAPNPKQAYTLLK